MKKKIAVIFMCLVMCLTLFTGCNLFPLDTARYLNAKVATIEYQDNSKIEITKKELLSAFDSYGTQLVQNYGMGAGEAILQTLNVLVNRKVILKEAESVVILTNADKNYLFDETLKALIANADEFQKEIIEEWGMEAVVTNPIAEDLGTIFAPYEKKAEVVFDEASGNYVIKILAGTSNVDEELKYDFDTAEGKQKLIRAYNSYIEAERTLVAAHNKYVKQLLKNEDGQSLSTDRDEVFLREAERIYKNLKENKYITKYQELNKDNSGISPITVDALLERYKLSVLQDYTRYKADPSLFSSEVLESSEIGNINYVPNSDFFFVSHILVKFTETQQKEYDSLEALRANGTISPLVYSERIQTLTNSVVATERDVEGKKVGSNKLVPEILTELNIALNSGRNEREKAEIFNSFIYRYNQDDGIMNAEYNYVVGVKESNMVESFTEASRKLDADGRVGAISEAVPSNYGVHIIFYAGKVQSIFNVSSADTFNISSENILDLVNARLNLGVDKTVFDKLYEEMLNDNYSIFESLNVNFLKQGLKITYHKNNYEDLYK